MVKTWEETSYLPSHGDEYEFGYQILQMMPAPVGMLSVFRGHGDFLVTFPTALLVLCEFYTRRKEGDLIESEGREVRTMILGEWGFELDRADSNFLGVAMSLKEAEEVFRPRERP